MSAAKDPTAMSRRKRTKPREDYKPALAPREDFDPTPVSGYHFGASIYFTPPPVDLSRIDFNPPTVSVPARDLKVGDVIMESADSPVALTKIKRSVTLSGPVALRGRYIWQHHSELSWSLGSFRSDHEFRRAV
jgi:hypothetical protein